MKNIIFFNSNKAWGGGEKWHFNMANALKNNGYNASLITNLNSELAEHAKEIHFPNLSLNLGNLSFLNPFKLLNLFFILKRTKPDAIFLNLPSDVKFCAPIAKFAGVKKVIYRRGMPNPIRNTALNRFFYSKVDIIIANSEEIKKTVCQNIKPLEEKIQIIYNGVEPRSNRAKEIHTPVRLGNLGRLVSQKGQIHLIEVAKILKDKYQLPFLLEIGGKGPLQEELEQRIRKDGLAEEVKLIGHTNPEEFFSRIDLFLFSSHFEGSANALIESLQFGVPAVAFDISSNPEVLEHETTGFLISPFDTDGFAKKVVELVKTPAKYKEFQTNCSRVIETKFNYNDKIKQIQGLVDV